MRVPGRLRIAVPLACLFLLACQLAPVFPQVAHPVGPPRMPPRDGAAQPQTGTATLRGRVVAADSGRPLRRARITLTAEGLGPEGRRTTSTNLEGRFEFRDLPAARYRVSVARGGYLPLEYGQRRPGEQGRPLQVADGQTLERIDFYLPRMGVITGRVTDENGEPIEGVSVYPTRVMFFDGARRLVPAVGPTQTDDMGEYRIARLPPGSYHVMAATKETWTVTERDGRETMYGYLPTYYPGVPSGSASRAVSVGIGQELSGIDIALLPGRAATVSGTAVDSQGRPFAEVSLSEQVRGVSFASFTVGPNARVAADGTFRIANVPPGTYTAQATRRDADPGGPAEVASLAVTIDGTDIENLMLVGSAGGTVSGRVVSETGELPKTGVRVHVAEFLRNQPNPAVLGAFRNTGPVPVREDGEFTANNVWGRARFRVTLPEGWMLKSVTHNGRDLGDAVLELRSGEMLAGVEILITNRITTLGGQVVDRAGKPVGDATVVVFAGAPERWYESSRWVRAARPDQQGEWQMKGLPPGEYYAAALDYVEDGAWNDPEFLEALRERARRLELQEGESLTIPLTPGANP